MRWSKDEGIYVICQGIEEGAARREIREDTPVVCFKGIADGCRTWNDVVKTFEMWTEWAREMGAKGYVILQSGDDYLFYEKTRD